MTTIDPNTKAKSDFETAAEIKKLLDGVEKAQQERILRWVAESLGLNLGHARQRHEEQHGTSGAPATPSGLQPSEEAPTASAPRAKDIRSFVAEKMPKSDVQFVAVVGYYHRFLAPERKESIGSEDLQQSARLAGRPVLKQPSMTLNNAVNQGYMDRAGRGLYKVNAVGENLVSMTLPDAGVKASTAKRVRKKASSSKRKPSRVARKS